MAGSGSTAVICTGCGLALREVGRWTSVGQTHLDQSWERGDISFVLTLTLCDDGFLSLGSKADPQRLGRCSLGQDESPGFRE